MAQLPSVFVTDDHEASSGFDPIPAGVYLAEIIKTQMKDTKDGTGKYLMVQFKIIEGDYAKRFVFTNLNLVNKSSDAVKIANSELKSICNAVGYEGELEDSEDLHNIPLGIKVVIREATSKWPASNEVKRYYREDDMPESDSGSPFA
jgi:hypothetical protein